MAAAQGNADAQNNLGLLYRQGLGITRDDWKAREWFEKAAKQGHTQAQRNLKELVSGESRTQSKLRRGEKIGIGSLPDEELRHMLELFRKAAKQGNPYARDLLKRLGFSE